MGCLFFADGSTLDGHPSTMPSARGKGDASGSGSKRGKAEQVSSVIEREKKPMDCDLMAKVVDSKDPLISGT
ncbi:hypothetical protein EJB05_26303, partial [Eragrostis curvula]